MCVCVCVCVCGELQERNPTSDVFELAHGSVTAERSGLSFSGGHTDECDDELPSSPTCSRALYEYRLSGASLLNHTRTHHSRSRRPLLYLLFFC